MTGRNLIAAAMDRKPTAFRDAFMGMMESRIDGIYDTMTEEVLEAIDGEVQDELSDEEIEAMVDAMSDDEIEALLADDDQVEESQIDEISQKLTRRYLGKSDADYRRSSRAYHKSTDARTKDGLMGRMVRRSVGAGMALDRLRRRRAK